MTRFLKDLPTANPAAGLVSFADTLSLNLERSQRRAAEVKLKAGFAVADILRQFGATEDVIVNIQQFIEQFTALRSEEQLSQDSYMFIGRQSAELQFPDALLKDTRQVAVFLQHMFLQLGIPTEQVDQLEILIGHMELPLVGRFEKLDSPGWQVVKRIVTLRKSIEDHSPNHISITPALQSQFQQAARLVAQKFDQVITQFRQTSSQVFPMIGNERSLTMFEGKLGADSQDTSDPRSFVVPHPKKYELHRYGKKTWRKYERIVDWLKHKYLGFEVTELANELSRVLVLSKKESQEQDEGFHHLVETIETLLFEVFGKQTCERSNLALFQGSSQLKDKSFLLRLDVDRKNKLLRLLQEVPDKLKEPILVRAAQSDYGNISNYEVCIQLLNSFIDHIRQVFPEIINPKLLETWKAEVANGTSSHFSEALYFYELLAARKVVEELNRRQYYRFELLPGEKAVKIGPQIASIRVHGLVCTPVLNASWQDTHTFSYQLPDMLEPETISYNSSVQVQSWKLPPPLQQVGLVSKFKAGLQHMFTAGNGNAMSDADIRLGLQKAGWIKMLPESVAKLFPGHALAIKPASSIE